MSFLGGSHLESRFCHWFFAESTARMGLVHLVVLVERLICASHWGGETGSPPLKSCGFFFFLNRGFFGGRGIARPPSSSLLRCVHLQYRCVLRRRKDWHLSLPPHNAGEYFGGGGTGPPLHNVREYLGGGRTGLPPRTVGVCIMPMTDKNDEVNFLYPPTYRAITVEGDLCIVTSTVRQFC